MLGAGEDRLRTDHRLDRHGKWLVIGGNLLVQYNQIYLEAAQAPKSMGREHLAQHGETIGIGDRDRRNRQIARNSVTPQACLAQRVARNPIARSSEPGIGVEYVAGQFLKSLGRIGLHAEISEL